MWGLLSACGVVDCGGYEAGTRVCIQLWVSGVVPCWMPVRCSRSCMVIAPASLLLMVKSPWVDFTSPTGVMTAAVPQAKLSMMSPVSTPVRQSSVEMVRSSEL